MIFLDALEGKNQGRPPIWLMRQAGRYLPEYRALREKYSLKELFLTPELAASITKMPIDRFGMDAAIFFSDITVVALALGLKLEFSEGPLIEPMGSIGKRLDVKRALHPIFQGIQLAKSELKVPLIGFCGGPFTVASYFIEKHTGQELPLTKKWLYQQPEKLHELLEAITEVSIEYLKGQVEAGVDAIQIFDSWAHVLSKQDLEEFCLPFLKRLIDAVDVPVLLFMRGASRHTQELIRLNPTGISFDWQCSLPEIRSQTSLVIQGNLDPDLLYAPLSTIRKKTTELLNAMEGDPAFILNLGHGVKPDVPVEAVQCLVETVLEKKHKMRAKTGCCL